MCYYLKPFLRSPLLSVTKDTVFSDLQITSVGAFSAITEVTWHYSPYFTNGIAQTGGKACPSHTDEFRVEFNFGT